VAHFLSIDQQNATTLERKKKRDTVQQKICVHVTLFYNFPMLTLETVSRK